MFPVMDTITRARRWERAEPAGNARKADRAGGRSGFTLLEILLAMFILVLIILMMARMFSHARIAWETGTRKSDLNMEGRAAINFMAHELSLAVADDFLAAVAASNGLGVGIAPGSTISFLSLTPEQERSISWVEYSRQGQDLRRRVVKLNRYWQTLTADSSPVIGNVVDLSFYCTGGVYETDLPSWVDIDLKLNESYTYSRVQVWSRGPDGVDSEDDISNWKAR